MRTTVTLDGLTRSSVAVAGLDRKGFSHADVVDELVYDVVRFPTLVGYALGETDGDGGDGAVWATLMMD